MVEDTGERVHEDRQAASATGGETTGPTDGSPFDQPLVRSGSRTDRSESFVHTAVVLVGALVVANLLVVIGDDLLSIAGISEAGDPVAWWAARLSLNFVGLIAVALAYLHWQEEPIVGLSRPDRRDLGLIAGGFVLFVAVMLALEFAVNLLGLEIAENVAIERGRAHPELFLVMIPLQVIFTAPAEELLFRGVIQGLYRRAYGIVPGILFASIIFALFHLPALVGSTGLVPVLTILLVSGLFLGAIYEYAENLLVPMAIHAGWNVFVFGTEYLGTVG